MVLKNEEIKKLSEKIVGNVYLPVFDVCVKAFEQCDDAIEGEIAALKAELTDAKNGKNFFSNRSLERGNELWKANNQIESLEKMIGDLKEKLNNERKHGEDLADINGKLASDNVDLKEKVKRLERNLTEQLAGSVTYQVISDLQKENKKLKDENIELNAQHDEDVLGYEELDEKYQAAMCEIKQLKEVLKKAEGPKDLNFGDVINVSWSSDDYMFIEETVNDMLRLYNITEKRLCYMAKHEHLTKIGECSFIPVG